MIGALRGLPCVLDKNAALIYVGGVGYEVRVSGDDIARLIDEQSRGAEVLLYTVFSVRQDKIELFGFLDKDDKELFEILTDISGVGQKMALAMVGAEGKRLMLCALTTGDGAVLAKLPGIGKKTSEKIVLEIRGNRKLPALLGEKAANNTHVAETISALVNLGINHMVASNVAHKAFSSNPELSLEDAIKHTLAMVKG